MEGILLGILAVLVAWLVLRNRNSVVVRKSWSLTKILLFAVFAVFLVWFVTVGLPIGLAFPIGVAVS